jgi:hypothetical protein
MSTCPNCGRQTLRTKDWACQWCGYPLVSKSYKPIDKTFKEFQEERNLDIKSTQPESVPEAVPESQPEERPEPAPEPEPEKEPEPLITPPPVPREELPPAAEPEVSPEPESIPEPEPEKVPEPPPEPKPEKKSKRKSKKEPKPEAEPEPLITPPPELKDESPVEAETVVEAEPEAEVKLEDVQDGMEITADQINALFKADKASAHKQFADKTLVVKGKVEKVFIREHLEIRYIVLTGTQKRMTWSLRCTFDKESSSKLTRLKEGEEVTVRGKYDGYSKNIIFKECELV